MRRGVVDWGLVISLVVGAIVEYGFNVSQYFVAIEEGKDCKQELPLVKEELESCENRLQSCENNVTIIEEKTYPKIITEF